MPSLLINTLDYVNGYSDHSRPHITKRQVLVYVVIAVLVTMVTAICVISLKKENAVLDEQTDLLREQVVEQAHQAGATVYHLDQVTRHKTVAEVELLLENGSLVPAQVLINRNGAFLVVESGEPSESWVQLSTLEQ